MATDRRAEPRGTHLSHRRRISEGRAAPPPNSQAGWLGPSPGTSEPALQLLASSYHLPARVSRPGAPTPARPTGDCRVFSPRSFLRCRSPYFQAAARAPRISSLHAVPSRQHSKQPAGLGAHQAWLSRPPLLATTAQPPKGLPDTFRGLGGASALPF